MVGGARPGRGQSLFATEEDTPSGAHVVESVLELTSVSLRSYLGRALSRYLHQ